MSMRSYDRFTERAMSAIEKAQAAALQAQIDAALAADKG